MSPDRSRHPFGTVTLSTRAGFPARLDSGEEVERAFREPPAPLWRPRPCSASDPALPAEESELGDCRRDDPAPRPPVAECPPELRNAIEVLAVEADDERGEEQHRRDHRQPLHHLVLVVRDLRDVVVADARDEVARELETVERAQELVVRGSERELDVVAE